MSNNLKPGQHTIEKIIGIGLGKTGTLSLTKAMEILGYKSKHGGKSLELLKQYDFINDIFVAPHYEFIDYLLPNSKFICCIRDIDQWLISNEKWSKKRGLGTIYTKQTRFALYKCFTYEESKFRAAHERYYREVREYFSDKQDKYMEINICNGEGWEKLCPFLNKNIPDTPFPHSHMQRKGTDDERRKEQK